MLSMKSNKSAVIKSIIHQILTAVIQVLPTQTIQINKKNILKKEENAMIPATKIFQKTKLKNWKKKKT